MRRKISELKREATHKVPSLNIGKRGISDTLIGELKKQLKRDRLVKVKILKTATDAMDRNAIATKLSRCTKSRLVEIRGNSAVFYLQ